MPAGGLPEDRDPANGSVAETITNNTVIGDAPISYIA